MPVLDGFRDLTRNGIAPNRPDLFGSGEIGWSELPFRHGTERAQAETGGSGGHPPPACSRLDRR